MINVKIAGAAPTHVDRLTPQFSVDKDGHINWTPGLIDYNASLFYRGRTITNEEFNALFLNSVYQGNYLTDSLTALFDKHLPTSIANTFSSTYNLLPSYTKSFTKEDWSERHTDGYYYITVYAEEHGFKPDPNNSNTEKMNIDTEVYLLDKFGQFYEVSQVEVDTENTVRIYTDDNTLEGFFVIRTNDKSFRLADMVKISVSQIEGLADVATSAKYTDLIDIDSPTGPNTRIAQNAADIVGIINGTHTVAKATNAENAEYTIHLLKTGTIQNVPITAIFEENSSIVKQAAGYSSNGTIALKFAEIDARLDDLGFKEGNAYINYPKITDVTQNKLIRHGNWCMFQFTAKIFLASGMAVLSYFIPSVFHPKTEVHYQLGSTSFDIRSDGTVQITRGDSDIDITVDVQLGWECDPL